MSGLDDLQSRVMHLERRLHRLHAVIVVCGAGAMIAVLTALSGTPRVSSVLRTKQLIVEDQAGRARIIVGAPVIDNFDRASPSSGLVIRDTSGVERFGVGLNGRGNMVLGLDAPRCTSDPCNTERITLVADADGGAHLRFLDRKTGAAALLYLADDDRAYLSFLKVGADSVRQRRIGLLGDTIISEVRHPEQ